MHKRTLLSLLLGFGVAVAAQAQTAPAVTPSADAQRPITVSIRCAPRTLSPAETPLLVVDGTVYEKALEDLSPNDIESITVLKGQQATALYGSQAQRGVLLITTKNAQRVRQKSTPTKLLIRPDELQRN